MTRREFLKGSRPKHDRIPIIYKEKCTGCGLCVVNCPTRALTISQGTGDNTYQLLFRHDLCNICGICEKSCPENCLKLERILELDRRGDSATVVFEDRMSRCHGCGIPLFPLAMVNHLKSKISPDGEAPFTFDLCPYCQIKIQLGREIVTKK